MLILLLPRGFDKGLLRLPVLLLHLIHHGLVLSVPILQVPGVTAKNIGRAILLMTFITTEIVLCERTHLNIKIINL